MLLLNILRARVFLLELLYLLTKSPKLRGAAGFENTCLLRPVLVALDERFPHVSDMSSWISP